MMNISVIIPTYNRSQTIEYCLKSVLHQTYQSFEIIVVDDCSRDNTVERVANIHDNRIRIIELAQHSGAQAARNVGIRNARYDWIAFQDSDDEWLLDKLEVQLHALAQANYDLFTVVHGNCLRHDIQNQEKTLWKLSIIEGNDAYIQLLQGPSPVFPSILVSKIALEKIEYLDENVPSYQEWDTSLRLAKICRFVHLNEPLFIYHLHGGETISKSMYRDILGYQYIINKFRSDIYNLCGETVWHHHLERQLSKIRDSHILDSLFSTPFPKEQEILQPLKEFIIDKLKHANEKKSELHELKHQYNELKHKYKLLENSYSYKIGNIIVKPFSHLNRIRKTFSKKFSNRNMETQ